MRPPKDSLDDFTGINRPKPAEPPSAKTLCVSGEVEVLKPLARYDGLAKRKPVARTWRFRPAHFRKPHAEFSWFHLSLAFGALALITFIGSSIFIAIFEPS